MKNLILLLTVLISSDILVGASKDLERVRDKVGGLLGVDVKHVDVYLESDLGDAVGVACGPDLVLIQNDYWSKITEEQKTALMMHEVLHTFGVLHNTRFTDFLFYGGLYRIPISIMFPSMFYLPQHRLEIFMEHYRLQSVEELKDGNRLNFMFVWVHTFTRRKCVDAVTSGFMKDFRELYDGR